MSTNPADTILQAVAGSLRTEAKAYLASSVARRLASVDTDPKFRYDPVARYLEAAVAKVAATDPLQVITASDISKLYAQIESLNPATDFKEAYPELFPDEELAQAPLATVPTSTTLSRHNLTDAYDSRPLGAGETVVTEGVGGDLEGGGDDSSSYGLPDFTIGDKQFEPSNYSVAAAAIKHGLTALGTSNIRVKHQTDAPELMVYKAAFVTTTGQHQIVIPVQVTAGVSMLPQAFGTNDGQRVYAFDREGFANFENDNRELALTKGRASANGLRADTLANDDTSRKPTALESFINKEEDDVVVTEGLDGIEASMSSILARKQSRYAGRTIGAGLELITRELRALGQYQAAKYVCDSKDGDLVFETALMDNRRRVATVRIPVEVKGQQLLFPSVFVSTANQAYPFSAKGIATYFASASEPTKLIDTKQFAKANYDELHKTIHAACVQRNYDVAERALASVGEKFGKEVLARTMKDYQFWLATASVAKATDSSIVQGFGRKLNADDWASLLQAELKENTGSDNVALPQGSSFEFAKRVDDRFDGSISTSQIQFT